MTGHDILIALGVTAAIGAAWVICEALRAPVGFEDWRGFHLGARYDDTLNNTTDEHADQRNFGFEAGTIHALPNTHERQHDHG